MKYVSLRLADLLEIIAYQMLTYFIKYKLCGYFAILCIYFCIQFNSVSKVLLFQNQILSKLLKLLRKEIKNYLILNCIC